MKMKIQVILGSTRENRLGIKAIEHIMNEASKYDGNISFEFVDLATFDLPHYNEPSSPRSSDQYTHLKTIAWSNKIKEADGFIFVTPEYNGYFTGALKDAIDYLYYEWYQKPYGIVGYGGKGAKRAVKQLHQLLSSFDMKRSKIDVGFINIWEAFKETPVQSKFIEGNLIDLFNDLEKL
jgi:NAD(P)H-dependent FMN reductase